MKLDYKLQTDEVAILWLETREVQILTIPGIDDVEDVEHYLETNLSLDMSNAYYMT